MTKDSKSINQLIYIIGIGGIGISALARWFKARGYEVTGSDLSPSSTTQELEGDGVKVIIGPHNAKNLPEKASRVIYNQAITKDNPELIKARELNIPTATYPASLGELTRIYKTIAIAGAHGKSTTTSLVALILQKAKLDPTVIVGTKLKEFAPPAGGSNFRNGKSEWLVIEADEWKASFLNYFPYATLITNIDREHLDFYKNLKNIRKTFTQFIYNVNPYGLIVLNRDNSELARLGKKLKRPVVWYGLKDGIAPAIKSVLQLPGDHNLGNALGAYALARALGIPRRTILSAIKSYRGSWRRSEYRGQFSGADIYDDYGHHPTEIRATLLGFKEKFPQKRLICVFQPHQRERLKLLFKDFVTAFDPADALILLDIYSVAGREEINNQITSGKLARAIEKHRGIKIPVGSNLKSLKDILAENLKIGSGDIIVMMGAGNINEWTDGLIK